MAITIKRKTGWVGMGTNISIEIDGKKVEKIPHDNVRDIELPNERASLRVSQMGAKSSVIEVKDGDIIEIKQKPWYRWINLFYGLLIFLSIFTLEYRYRTVFIIIVGVLIILSMLIFNGYNLEIIDEK